MSNDNRKSVAAVIAAIGVCIVVAVVLLAFDNPLIDSLEIRVAKNYVIMRLKDPDSVKFGDVFASKTFPESNVCGFVNARNGFGGYTGMTPFIYSKSTNAVQMMGDDKVGAWRAQCIESPAPIPASTPAPPPAPEFTYATRMRVWDGAKFVDARIPSR